MPYPDGINLSAPGGPFSPGLTRRGAVGELAERISSEARRLSNLSELLAQMADDLWEASTAADNRATSGTVRGYDLDEAETALIALVSAIDALPQMAALRSAIRYVREAV
jgi:hypothetical protein